MKHTKLTLMILLLSVSFIHVQCQENVLIPDLSKIAHNKEWKTVNREVIIDSCVFLNSKPGDGVLYLKGTEFKNGTIELDIKGENNPGQSFVGLAFHGANDSTFDAVYFRPFNFKNPQRSSHSVQYISMPQHDWYNLRSEHPGEYENTIVPAPDPENWFHATIVVNYPAIQVFVNNSDTPSLTVDQISPQQKGWIGFWVGNNSKGWFKNLKIVSESEND